MIMNTRGGLGDAYIIVCKLLALDKLPLEVNHNMQRENKDRYSSVKEIYSLLPNMKVNIILTEGIPTKGMCGASSKHQEYFPIWKLHNNFDVKKPYTILQAHSGGNNSKMFDVEQIKKFIENSNRSVVLLGTENIYKDIDCINLIGKTTILETIPTIQNAESFIGPAGLLGFIALSQRISTTLYFTSGVSIDVRIKRTPWAKYCKLIRGLDLEKT